MIFNNMSAPSVVVTSFLKPHIFSTSSKRGLVSGSNPRGTEHLPTVTAGYFVTAEEPLEVRVDGTDWMDWMDGWDWGGWDWD